MRLVFILFLYSWFLASSVCAQEFVDAPPVLDTPVGGAENGSSGGVESFGGGHFNQVSSGMVNYGYKSGNHVFAQYTGDEDYQKGASPSSLFGNLTYLDVTETNFLDILKGWAWGLEWLYFTATPESTASAVGVIVAPPVSMTLNMLTTNARMYFRDLSQDSFQPFIGIGLGVISGEMDATLVEGGQTRSTFNGLMHFRTFGANVSLGPRSGVVMEARTLSAPWVRSSNDPYNQGNGSLSLDFGGSMVNLTGYLRF